MTSDWISLAQAAHRLRQDYQTTYRQALSGALDVTRSGSRWLVRRSSLERVRRTLAAQSRRTKR